MCCDLNKHAAESSRLQLSCTLEKNTNCLINSHTKKIINLSVTYFIYALQLLLATSREELIQVKLNSENGQVLVWGVLSKLRRTINERCTDISSLKLPPDTQWGLSQVPWEQPGWCPGMGEGAA